MGRSDTDGLKQVAHRQRVVPLGLVHDEGQTFTNHLAFGSGVLGCRFGVKGIHMNVGNLLGGVDGTLGKDELHIVGVHLHAITPLSSGVQSNHNAVVIGEVFFQVSQKVLNLAVQGIIGDKRFVNQVKTTTHRPGSHPAFGKGVERRGSAPLLTGQVERLLAGKRTFDLVASTTRKDDTTCRESQKHLGSRFHSNHYILILCSQKTASMKIAF